MKKLVKILFSLFFIITISGCSSSKISEEYAKNIVNSIEKENIEDIKFDIKNNKMSLIISDEFINKEEALKIIKSFKIQDKTGINAFKKENFNNSIFDVEIKNSQNNIINFSTNDVENFNLKIINNKYSQKYIEENILKIKKEILLFNEIVGKLEIELKKNNNTDEILLNYNKIYKQVTVSINKINKFNNNNSDYNLFEEKILSIKKAHDLIDMTNNSVKLAIDNKQYTYISNIFLNINDLDKIARTI